MCLNNLSRERKEREEERGRKRDLFQVRAYFVWLQSGDIRVEPRRISTFVIKNECFRRKRGNKFTFSVGIFTAIAALEFTAVSKSFIVKLEKIEAKNKVFDK